MSLALMEEKAAVLDRFSLTEKQAVFLSLVAHYSGYFTSDQYQRFSGTTQQNASLFMDKATSSKLIRTYKHENGKLLCHLHSRPIYEALDIENNRHRRLHEIIYIKAKLMAFDFILEHPELNFLATEEDRVSFFSDQGITLESLPVKTYQSPTSDTKTKRYFVDKYPIFTADTGGGFVVTFCYIDPVMYTTGRHFRTHLESYRKLFQGLQNFRLLYISHDEKKMQNGRKIFQEYSETLLKGGQVSAVQISPELMDYFQIKRDIELEAYEKITGERGGRYRKYLEKYSGDEAENLYRKWLETGTKTEESGTVQHGYFDSVLLPNRYRFLGGNNV